MFSSKDIFFTPPATTGYRIEKSLRFRRSASAYLSRTPGTAGNRKTFTLSAWIKRGLLSAEQGVFYRVSNIGTDTDSFAVTLLAADTLSISGYSTNYRITTQVFRDTSAWYHIVVAVDTTQATANNRIRLYVNGVEVTAFSTTNNPTQNADTGVNSTAQHSIGSEQTYTSSREFDGYMSDVYLIDGQQLTPSSFGENNATTGVWQPKAYTGTYGTNGSYLKFSDATSATTLSYDYSGNGNNWTPNNISVTAGTTYDSMIDTPTPYDDGGTGRGNYAVLNSLDTGLAPTEANLSLPASASAWRVCRSTMSIPEGTKAYWEVTISGVTSNNIAIGVDVNSSTTALLGTGANGWSVWPPNSAGSTAANKYNNSVSAAVTLPSTAGTNDVYMFAVDRSTNSIWVGINGNWVGSVGVSGAIYTNLPSTGVLFPALCNYNQATYLNCGQRPFTYTPPSGFKALNTQNLPTPTIANGAQYMAATTYTGTGSAMSVANTVNSVSFQPDLIWIKQRNNAATHVLADAVRGVSRYIFSNLTNAEATATAGTGITAFSADGFTLGTETSTSGSVNAAGGTGTYVAWQWKANGSGSSNTSGSITSTVSANATAGFSVVTYTGTGANATVGHGLGVAPSMIIVKSRTGAYNWNVYTTTTGSGNVLQLNTTAASTASSDAWNSTSPTFNSSVFSVGTNVGTNESAKTYVAYCFAAVAGYSAFGSYTGNGSADGPFVFTGFRPRWILWKKTSAIGEWILQDTSRSTYNAADAVLYPDLSDAEGVGGGYSFDILSNGFKMRNAASYANASSATYIYAAFAENPFKYALAR